MLQSISTQIDGAQKALVEKSKRGYKTRKLQFCSYHDYHTFTYSQTGFKLEKKGTSDFLYLSKLSWIELGQHRLIPQNSTIKQVLVTKSSSGRWFACVTIDIQETLIKILKISFKKSIGIDVGVKSFAYDGNGSQIPNPKNLQKMLKPLKRIQRKVSRRKKGSKYRLKSILKMQKVHEKIVNKRRDFQHKLSTQYAKDNDMVFVEKLNLTGMVKNHRLAQSILDASWNTFVQKLECKMLVKVDPKNTTIDCSRCGNKIPKSLAVRIHRCDKCNLVLDRDYNASVNILNKRLNLSAKANYNLPQELEEVTLVKSAMHSMKQEKVIQLVRW